MKKILFALAVMLTATFSGARADDGMWVLGDLTKQTYDAMRARGFMLTPEELSSESGTSLRNGVVLFGGFCSGVVVSHDGLVLTNHHCGFGSIQQHSTPEHDYVKNGFVAATRADEWRVPGLYVSFPVREVKVTDRVLPLITKSDASGVTHQVWGRERAQLLDSIETLLVKEVTDKDSTLWAELKPYYGRNEYYLTVYRVYPDVRLVLAPPASLGKFGGDTDNWVWPRETCDFSMFRIYAGKDNMPAAYSPDNVPYKPTRVVQVALDGYKAGDFAMTLGFPGSTERYLSARGIENHIATSTNPAIESGSLKLSIWKQEMDADPVKRLKYDSKYQSFSNYYKNSIGMNRSIAQYDIIGVRRAFEQGVKEWIDADENRKAQYGDVFDKLNESYDACSEKAAQFMTHYLMLNYKLDAVKLVSLIAHGDFSKKSKAKGKLLADARELYRNLDFALDARTIAAGLWKYRNEMPAETHPSFFKEVENRYHGNFSAYVNSVSRRTIIGDSTVVMKRLRGGKNKWIKNDAFATMMFSIGESLVKLQTAYDMNPVNEAERRLTQAVREMYQDSPLYSDANMTLRMSYGTVKTYTPAGGSEYPLYTTPQTLAAKAAKAAENKDYVIENDVLSLMTGGSYGRYADKTSKNLQLCFVTDNDITGGNSGSPIFNGKGQLLGLAFDGNWESMANDLKYSRDFTRCIGVDIRYVMYVIDRWAKADRLMKEFTFAE